MRTEVRISFDAKRIAGGPATILDAAGCGADVAEVRDVSVLNRLDVEVILDDSDPRLGVLLDLLKRHGASWLDLRWDRYTDDEIGNAPLLVMDSKNDCQVFGGPRAGTTYEMTNACPVCGSGARQTSPMMIDGADLSTLEGQRATATYYRDILVDEALAEAMESSGAKGISFRPVYAMMSDKRQMRLRWRQMCSEHVLPPMSPRTTGVLRRKVCHACGKSGFRSKMDDPARLVYRHQDIPRSVDMVTTWEHFGDWDFDGNVSEALWAYPWVLVTPKVWRVFRDAGVTSFDWLPIRVEDD